MTKEIKWNEIAIWGDPHNNADLDNMAKRFPEHKFFIYNLSKEYKHCILLGVNIHCKSDNFENEAIANDIVVYPIEVKDYPKTQVELFELVERLMTTKI